MSYLNLVGLLGGANSFFDLYTGGAKRPVLFSASEIRPELCELDRHSSEIRAELVHLLQEKGSIPRYHDLDQMQTGISARVNPDKDWKVFYLYAIGEKPEVNRAKCPQTAAILDRVPGLFQAFFSILEGGKSIPAHCGPYRGYLRYHLALVVPKNNPPSIRVKDHHHTWREGESFMFDDSWNHEVYNEATEDRVVLIVDIRRPMPLPFHLANRVVEFVMRQVYGKQILKKLA